MIRRVRTGDLGLDLLVGGGWCLVERLPGRESATILLRGGPGSGKTLLSVDVALALAQGLKGDVVVGCVELLPTEFFAQMEAGRAELVSQYRDGPLKSEPRVVMLPQREPVTEGDAPRLFCGLLTDLDPVAPDLVAALESLRREVSAIGGRPAVLVVDSLSNGYGSGAATPRQNVDALMKFAASEGIGLVLCAETTDDEPSVWDFAVDSVVSLEHRSSGDRLLMVQKHRFGPSVPGSHRLEILGWQQPRVSPRLNAWFGRHQVHETLHRHGWMFMAMPEFAPLRWIDKLGPTTQRKNGFGCSFGVVSAPNLEVARRLAYGLIPVDSKAGRDIVIELDPLGFDSEGGSSKSVDIHFVPIGIGPAAAICDLVEYLGEHLFGERTDRPRRILIGDIGTVASSADSSEWAEAIRVIASLIAETGCGVPLIAYDSSAALANQSGGIEALRWSADLVVEVSYTDEGIATGKIKSRFEGIVETIHWPQSVFDGPWPKEIAHLARLPGPRYRRHFRATSKKRT